MGTIGTARDLTREQVREMTMPLCALLNAMVDSDEIEDFWYVGSFRRKEEGINDLDILVEVIRPEDAVNIISAVATHGSIDRIDTQGSKRARFILKNGVQVDFNTCTSDECGAAMLHHTGSKEFNIHCRASAKRKGLKLNEYGLWDANDTRVPNTDTEEKILAAIGVHYTEPERR